MNVPDLLLHRDGPVAHLVLNRPRARNAITQAMLAEIPGLVAAVAADESVRVLVLRGVDPTAFAAGADIAEFERVYATPEAARASSDAFDRAMTAVAELEKPTVAMIQGPCIGGGCALALACDVRFADANARFAVTPAKLGLAYPIKDTRRLIAAVGLSHAKDLLFSGRLLDAHEALRLGLVDRVVAPEAIAGETGAWVASVVETSRASHAATKQVIRRIVAGASDDDAVAARAFLELFGGADFTEGYRAFLAKRKPSF
jgi:enoyl-CoA hydratase/carnithine racemase